MRQYMLDKVKRSGFISLVILGNSNDLPDHHFTLEIELIFAILAVKNGEESDILFY